MPRAGLNPDRVVEEAIAVIDELGPGALSLATLAERLGVKAPSLYNHGAGLDDLRRRVALAGIDGLADALRNAVMGRSGRDALQHLAAAYREFASMHPGLYPFTQQARPEDAEYAARSMAAVEPLLAVLGGYGLAGDDAIDAARAVRSAIHGFVALETGKGFGLSLDPDDSFAGLVAMLDSGLANRSVASRAATQS